MSIKIMSFRVLQVSIDGKKHDLSPSVENHENFITVITGKNGSGKSRILEFISNNFVQNDDFLRFSPHRWNRGLNTLRLRYDSNTITYQSSGYDVVGEILHKDLAMAFVSEKHPSERYDVFPSKLVCLSTSPFDRFPSTKRPKRSDDASCDDPKDSIYTYVGLKSSSAALSVKGLITNVIDTILKSSERIKKNVGAIRETLDYLGYGKRIRLTFKSTLPSSVLLSDDLKTSIRFILSEHPELLEQSDHIREAISVLRTKHANSKGQFSVSMQLVEPELLSDEYMQAVRLLLNIGLIRILGFKLSLKTDNRKFITFNHASSGEQCLALMMLGIASVIEDNSLICIDEPEISLHPEWQEEFIPMIQNSFSLYNGCHFIIATHSPLIISKLNSSSCSVLDLDRNKLVEKLNSKEFSSDYQLATLFDSPGFKNQYLLNESLEILSLLSKSVAIEEDTLLRAQSIIDMIPSLDQEDPVLSLASAIKKVVEV
ncbi:ATP-binding protein [Vibrio harveyi]|uniref:ATP-binding protein n=1 Tax=Vibrio harveyi TaxID=669 RepID=UPI00247FBAC0|nr:AAA family ATPase [Vibrio harveyi]